MSEKAWKSFASENLRGRELTFDGRRWVVQTHIREGWWRIQAKRPWFHSKRHVVRIQESDNGEISVVETR